MNEREMDENLTPDHDYHRRHKEEVPDETGEQRKRFDYMAQMRTLESLPYEPVPIGHIPKFKLRVKCKISPEHIPVKNRNGKAGRKFVKMAKINFLEKYFGKYLRITNGTYCKNRYMCVDFQSTLEYNKVPANKILPLVFNTSPAAKIRKKRKSKSDTQKKSRKTKRRPRRKEAKNSVPELEPGKEDLADLKREAVPISYALNTFTNKFLLVLLSYSVRFPTTKFKRRRRIIRTAKFRFLKKHFRSMLKIKKNGENWTCCKNRYDALDPSHVLNSLPPQLLMPFVRVTKAKAIEIFKEEQNLIKANRRRQNPSTPPTLTTPTVTIPISPKTNDNRNEVRIPKAKVSSVSVLKKQKEVPSLPSKKVDVSTSAMPAWTIVIKTEPIEEIVIDSDSEKRQPTIKIEPPSPMKELPINSQETQQQQPVTLPVVEPPPSCAEELCYVTPSEESTIPPGIDPVSGSTPDVSTAQVPESDSDDASVVASGSKRKRTVLSSDEENSGHRSRSPQRPVLKSCSVTLRRMSPPGLRHTREWQSYKRIRLNKPLVVEDVRKLMIGSETVRPRINSESESDTEFNPEAVNSSAQSSSDSETVLSNETDSPSSPPTEQSGGPDSEEYGASEREEEEEQRRYGKYNKPIIVVKTVEERRQAREQRKQKKAKLAERKKARKEYVKTFMGHLSYAPVGIRYAVDVVTKKLRWDVFPYGAKVLGRTLGKKELDSLSRSQESKEWDVLKQAFILKHFREAFRVNKGVKKEWTCCRNTVDFLDCKAFLKLFWNININ